MNSNDPQEAVLRRALSLAYFDPRGFIGFVFLMAGFVMSPFLVYKTAGMVLWLLQRIR